MLQGNIVMLQGEPDDSCSMQDGGHKCLYTKSSDMCNLGKFHLSSFNPITLRACRLPLKRLFSRH
jgi:hypothetical protein